MLTELVLVNEFIQKNLIPKKKSYLKKNELTLKRVKKEDDNYGQKSR